MTTSTEKIRKSAQTTPDCKDWFLYRPRTRSAKKKIIFSDTIVISSDSEGSDVECSYVSKVAETVTKKEITIDCPPLEEAVVPAVIANDSSEKLQTSTCIQDGHVLTTSPVKILNVISIDQMVENQQNQNSKKSNDNDLTEVANDGDGETKEKLLSFECNSNADNSEPVANDSTANSATEVSIDGQSVRKCLQFESNNGSDSDDSIDMMIKRVHSSAQKLFECGECKNDDHGPIESNATDTFEDSVTQEADQENLQVTNYGGVDSPCKPLVYTCEHDDSVTTALNCENSDESDDSFGLVIDENHEKNLTDVEDCDSVQNDCTNLKDGQEDEDQQESDDCSVVIVKQDFDDDAMNLDDYLPLPTGDKDPKNDGTENPRVAAESSDEIRFQECITTKLFNTISHQAKKKSFLKSRSVSDDELATKGRYGVRVKDEVNAVIPTSYSFRFRDPATIEKVRFTENQMSKTNEMQVCSVLEVSFTYKTKIIL